MIRASLIAAAAAALPLGLSAQRTPAPRTAASRAAAMPPASGGPTLTAAQREMQGWYMELMQIGQRLQNAQLRAMQDPQLRAEQEALGRDLKAAVVRVDPGLANLEPRARAMEAEALRAKQAGDQARLAKLIQDAQQIQVRLMNAQNRVMREQPALAARGKSFEEKLRRKMIQVEPQTMALVERGKVLQSRLATASRAQQQGARH